MWIVRLALRRPYTFVVLALAILLVGPLAILRTPKDIFPNINIPVVAVIWSFNGLSAEEISNRMVAIYERMDAGPRTRTWTDLEAGLASENLLLQAVALKLGAVVVGGMDPVAAKEAVRFGGKEQVIVLIPVGHPEG